MVSLLARWLRWHVVGYLAVNGLLIAVNVVVGGGWWTFWPFMVLSLLLACHYLFVRSATANDDWAKARTTQILIKSYDLGHIRDIERSYENHAMPGAHPLNPPESEADAADDTDDNKEKP